MGSIFGLFVVVGIETPVEDYNYIRAGEIDSKATY
jgi:hypothetical protein